MTLKEFSAAMPASLLLISQILLLWSIANYGIASDPVQETNRPSTETLKVPRLWLLLLMVRSCLVGVFLLIIAGPSKGALILTLLLIAGCLLLPVARRWWVPPTYGAELEIGTNGLFVVFTLTCVMHWHLKSLHNPTLPFSETRISALCLIAAIAIFSIRGATYIVRGILNKCGALPELVVPEGNSVVPRTSRVVSETAVDAVEFNRGRWIGNLERILLLVIIADASYESIAFLMAAKSLIRSKDLENREWAEYFLLGTLASVVVALGAGLAIRAILKAFW